jgi:hypothetical protein
MVVEEELLYQTVGIFVRRKLLIASSVRSYYVCHYESLLQKVSRVKSLRLRGSSVVHQIQYYY